MRIKQILIQLRRDFKAEYECEHCGMVKIANGYDDSYFHSNIIPKMTCAKCGKIANDNYSPLATKYPEGTVI